MPALTQIRPPEQGELEALIEEARRRARRRRLGYTAALVGLLIAGGLLYAGFGHDGGGGVTSQGRPFPADGSGASAARSSSAGKRPALQRRCPGHGLSALTLGPDATTAARSITARRVGSSPQIDVAIHPGTWAESAISYLCGTRIARRTLYVATYDHSFDHGPNRSASLAQHRFYVSRFDDGYRAWYWEH